MKYPRKIILRIILHQQQTKGIVSLTHLAANIRILFSLLLAAVFTQLLGRPRIRDMGSISILIWKILCISRIISTRYLWSYWHGQKQWVKISQEIYKSNVFSILRERDRTFIDFCLKAWKTFNKHWTLVAEFQPFI